MAALGLAGLVIALAGAATAAVLFALSAVRQGRSLAKKQEAKQKAQQDTAFLAWLARVLAIVSTLALVFCCALLIFCFMSGDLGLSYVVQYRVTTESSLKWLYTLSGLWAGREGSLLFWTTAIALFAAVVALRSARTGTDARTNTRAAANKQIQRLDNAALSILLFILALFVAVLLFGDGNQPFVALPAEYLSDAGQLTGSALNWGMSPLLEHWAMVLHPPTLFIGYAGLTVPFAYAISALILKDASALWVRRAQRITLFAWLFLSIGIGIGAVWAYVVLGWGGYWGWDPVENISLLPWLVTVALIHNFTVYQRQGLLKRWAIACACLAFAFVALGAFITRSGVVGSVHAFDGDDVSSGFFIAMFVLPLLAGAVGLGLRRKLFSDEARAVLGESLLTKNAAYYLNNIFMLVSAFVLAYMTVASALPDWLPFGGYVFSAVAYNVLARPLGLIYLLIVAMSPLLTWGKTSGNLFWKSARLPGILALLLFAGLVAYHFLVLTSGADSSFGASEAVSIAGAANARSLGFTEPLWYLHLIAVVGYLCVSLLFFTSLFMLGRNVKGIVRSRPALDGAAAEDTVDAGAAEATSTAKPAKATSAAPTSTAFTKGRARSISAIGGALAHMGLAVMLLGLIGSSMFVTSKTASLGYADEGGSPVQGSPVQELTLNSYRLELVSDNIAVADDGSSVYQTLQLRVYDGEQYVGDAAPSLQIVTATEQQQLHAHVFNFAADDLFIVYRGTMPSGLFSVEARINPLIDFVWAGIGLLVAGTLVALLGRRRY